MSDTTTAAEEQTTEEVEAVPEITGVMLLDDEKVLHDIRPSWAMYSGSLLWGFLTIWILVGVVFFAYAWLARRNKRYVVTNQRLIEKKGLFSSNSTEYRISDIRQLQTGASWNEKFAGCGHLKFSSGSGSMITFEGIPNHQTVANTIRQQQQELE